MLHVQCGHAMWAFLDKAKRLDSFNREKYLDIISNKTLRIALKRFRLSSHQLEIETGRHKNINSDERKCLQYNMNSM